MRVIPIRSKMMFKDFDPRTDARVSEGVKFLCGVMLTLWCPPLMACLVLGHAMPLYWMLATETMGALWGVTMYNKPSSGSFSCVPVNYVSHVVGIPKVGKAA
jgi:hypothetical protein